MSFHVPRFSEKDKCDCHTYYVPRHVVKETTDDVGKEIKIWSKEFDNTIKRFCIYMVVAGMLLLYLHHHVPN